MKLSLPIHVLKSQAKKLKRESSITMSEALNQIAKREGYTSWSLLITKSSDSLPDSFVEVLDYFNAGDLGMVGARPSKGKTSFCLGLFALAAKKRQAKNYFFSLSEVAHDVIQRLNNYDSSIQDYNQWYELDFSNDICADYIIEQTSSGISQGSLILVDYLQLLDEKRSNPTLQNQVEKLKAYAKENKCIIVIISQIRRELENQVSKRPTLEDIRLPNPLDLGLFNKIILLCRRDEFSGLTDVIYCKPKDYVLTINWDKSKGIFK
jgi:replicative DNA helicase